MSTTMTINERLDAIARSGWEIAWDGCHKMYLLPDPEQVRDAQMTGYDIYPAANVRKMWEDSCGLRFINNWGLIDGTWDHEFAISQFEETDDDEDEEGYE